MLDKININMISKYGKRGHIKRTLKENLNNCEYIMKVLTSIKEYVRAKWILKK